MLVIVALATTTSPAAVREALSSSDTLRVVQVSEPDGQILSFRHLGDSTEVEMRGTKRAPGARVKLKIGGRPGFVELDINRGGISGLGPAYRFGRDFLTYVLWAVSVDGRASNLGEITFENSQPVAVNVTTPYQTFWLMVTAEPNYAVVDPSTEVVLYSVKQPAGADGALAIHGNLFYFTHYTTYRTGAADAPSAVPNQLLQARKAVDLASRSGVLADARPDRGGLKEEAFAQEAIGQARRFLRDAETAYERSPRDRAVIQFARTSAQIAENARALAMGAVGGLSIHRMQSEIDALKDALARAKAATPAVELAASPAVVTASSEPVVVATDIRVATPLVKQPALWFAVAGWAVALVLLFRQRPV